MRRLLRMSWDEWRALPWHEQRALREGIFREKHPDAAFADQPSTPEEEAAHLAAMGFSVS